MEEESPRDPHTTTNRDVPGLQTSRITRPPHLFSVVLTTPIIYHLKKGQEVIISTSHEGDLVQRKQSPHRRLLRDVAYHLRRSCTVLLLKMRRTSATARRHLAAETIDTIMEDVRRGAPQRPLYTRGGAARRLPEG